MNLIFLVVCNVVVIFCSFGIPQQRNSHVVRPDSTRKFQSISRKHHIPLQVLENELLHSKNKIRLNTSPYNIQEKKRRRHLNKSCRPAFRSRSKIDEMYESVTPTETRISYKHPPREQQQIDPESKSKINKTFKRSFEPESEIEVSSQEVQSTFQDFFGLFGPDFTTNASANVVTKSSNQDMLRDLKSSVTLSFTNNGKTELYSDGSTTVENPKVVEDSFNQTTKYPGSNKVARRIDLSAKESNLECKSNLLNLDKSESPKNDLNSFFNQDEEGRDSDSNTSEGAVTENHFNLFTSSNENTDAKDQELLNSVTSQTTVQLVDIGRHPQNTTAMTSPNVKLDCELQSHKKCICSFATLGSEIHSIFAQSTSPRIALEKIKDLVCNKYVPKVDIFEVSSHSKPKDLDKQKKAIAVNEEKGPKEIDRSSLNEFISQSVLSEEDEVVNVFAGTDVKVPCFPSDGIHLLSSETDDVKYRWSHHHNKPISEGHIKENADGEGTLSFEDINISDSDNYTCNVEYINPDSGHLKKETYTHSVSVVSLPLLTLHVLVHYRAPQCGNSVTDIFRRYLPTMVERAICDIGDDKHLCSVEIHNAVCVDSSSSSSTSSDDAQPIERSERKVPSNQPKEPYWLRRGKRDVTSKEISLNYEVCVHKRDERSLTTPNSSLCDANCHLVIGLKLLQLFRESMTEAVTTPVSLNMNNISGIFYPVVSTVKIKYIFGCLGGEYYKGQGFCTACPRHTFSEHGAIVCTHCPPHTYQGGMGASKCIPCSIAWMPACNEYLEDTNKFIVTVVAVIVLIVLLVAVIWYCFGNKERRDASVKKLVSSSTKKRTTGSARKVKFGKSQKSIRRKLQAKNEPTELQPFLDSSTGGETSGAEDTAGE